MRSGRVDRSPRRSSKRPPRLLEPVEWGLVRAALLPVEDYPQGVDDSAPDGLVAGDPRVRAALAVGTDHLFAALQGGRGSAPAPPRLRAKLLRYLIRMATRPTPYGLFAGVGLIEWDSTTDLALAEQPLQTRARPDMGWLFDLVVELERDPEIRRKLRLFANPLALTRAGWVFLTERAEASDSSDGAARGVRMRATPAVKRLLARARTPTAYADLAADLLSRPGATPAKVEGLIDELWRQSLLLTDLRPPLTGAPPGRYVHDRLRTIPRARRVQERLGALLKALDRWETLPLEERAEGWARLTELADETHRSSRSASVQVDMGLPLVGRRVPLDVANEAAAAAELLLCMSPYPAGLPHLHAYRKRFEHRYGREREVPLLELLDPELGLGPPGEEDYRSHLRQPAPDPARRRALLEVALDALRERRMVVELDDALLSQLQSWSPTPDTTPRSLDISVFLAAASAADIDAGDFTVIVGPNLGGDAAGRTLGRFADLLGPEAATALETVARQDEPDGGRLWAELVYLPRRARSANVAIRPAGADHEIVYGTTPAGPPEKLIPLDELVVGVRNGRFYIRWPAADAEVAVSEMHMLNPLHAPASLMFLQDVQRDRQVVFAPFNWGPAAEFPFLPRVQRGRVALALARWRIDATSQLDISSGSFSDTLGAWRESWSVPRHVYLAEGDNRLLLDLENPAHADLLRDDLRRKGAKEAVVVEEALPSVSDAWLPGPDGRHLAELVVPLVARAPPALRSESPYAPRHATPVPPALRLRPPGSDWLFLKLYCSPAFHDQLIADDLGPFADFATSARLARAWFFVRYSDPEPHLRVRFRGEPDVLVSRLLPKLCAWATSLVADGSCVRFGFDTYEREVERYGGEAGLEVAEDLFHVDSRATAALLRREQDSQHIDRTALAVLSVDALLGDLGVGAPERLDLYSVVPLSRPDGQDYRPRKELLRRLLAQGPAAEPGGQALARVLDDRRRALKPIAARLDALGREEVLKPGKSSLWRDHVHMHCNRLLDTSLTSEERVLQLARRARESLTQAPLDATPAPAGLDRSDAS